VATIDIEVTVPNGSAEAGDGGWERGKFFPGGSQAGAG